MSLRICPLPLFPPPFDQKAAAPRSGRQMAGEPRRRAGMDSYGLSDSSGVEEAENRYGMLALSLVSIGQTEQQEGF